MDDYNFGSDKDAKIVVEPQTAKNYKTRHDLVINDMNSSPYGTRYSKMLE